MVKWWNRSPVLVYSHLNRFFHLWWNYHISLNIAFDLVERKMYHDMIDHSSSAASTNKLSLCKSNSRSVSQTTSSVLHAMQYHYLLLISFPRQPASQRFSPPLLESRCLEPPLTTCDWTLVTHTTCHSHYHSPLVTPPWHTASLC